MSYTYVHKPKVRNIYIEAYDRFGGVLLERFVYLDLPLPFVMRWKWFFKYRHALLQVKYPRGYINTISIDIEPDGRSLKRIRIDSIKNEIKTCKRMITKLSNAIREFELFQEKTLIPHWDNPKYIKAKSKLDMYKDKKKGFEKELSTLWNK